MSIKEIGGGRRALACLALAVFFTSSCATYEAQPSLSNAERAYKEMPYASQFVRDAVVIENPEIRMTTEEQAEQEMMILLSKGFYPLGEVMFKGRLLGSQELLDLARKVNAPVVLGVHSEPRERTYTKRFPVTKGLQVVGYEDVEFRYDEYQQAYTFFMKAKRSGVYTGMIFKELTPEVRKSIRRNSGMMVASVIEGSPAFLQDIFVDDVVLKVNGQSVSNKYEYELLVGDHKTGEALYFSILSGGSIREVEIIPEIVSSGNSPIESAAHADNLMPEVEL